MNNIEFSIVPNKTNTKFKIAWTINLGDYPKTKVMSREFPSEEAAQEYLDKNKEKLEQTINERISKISINLKDEEVEVVAEVTTEDSVENTEEVEVVAEVTAEDSVENTEEETSLVPAEEMSLVPVEEEEEKVARTPSRKVKIAKRIIAGAIAVVLIIGMHHVIRRLKDDETPGVPNPEAPTTDTTPETEEPVEKTLTTEEFENLVAQLAKVYQDKNVELTTEDIAKFVAIINIDTLAEDNKDLASELFENSTSEEYIQDAADVISETVMYNARVFEEEKSTENFIRISDALYGEEKESLKVIESYVDEIAKVYYDSEQVNILTSELITRLSAGDLQELNNGAQFGMQISIELIRSYIAKDVLYAQNRDVLTDITRLNVSGIMNTYNSVNEVENAKTLTK